MGISHSQVVIATWEEDDWVLVAVETLLFAPPVFLPGKSNGQRSLGDYSPWGCKESDPTEQLNHHRPDTEFSALC